MLHSISIDIVYTVYYTVYLNEKGAYFELAKLAGWCSRVRKLYQLNFAGSVRNSGPGQYDKSAL